jgi:UDP-N-acetylglucosamine/UDP-N-acetylgalactosamine 4-epimerase
LSRILITGGAGFIGSNLVDHFLSENHQVVVLDDLSTGFESNIEQHYDAPDFTFIKGDIRDIEVCRIAMKGCDYVLHQAALGSVPRSIQDPATTNDVNISGFLNMLIAARDEGVIRFVYAASSSTYGDSRKLPKIEEEIGSPLSPYAVTKLVNELYSEVFAKTYKMQCIGLRYFNVFGKRQSPDGAYAAVIPLWSKQLLNYESPIINGDGEFSRDFTYIMNVVQANEKAIFVSDEALSKGRFEYYNLGLEAHKYHDTITKSTSSEDDEVLGLSEVFNIACGGNITLIELFTELRKHLAKHDAKIEAIEPIFGPYRAGDIPHSQASIRKAEIILGYKPDFNVSSGFSEVVSWYNNNY